MRYRFMIWVLAFAFFGCLYERTYAQNSRFVAYKQKMMPDVGKKVSVTGILQSGKLGWFLAADGWGIYIYATTEAGSKQQDHLERFLGRRVRATGILLHR